MVKRIGIIVLTALVAGLLTVGFGAVILRQSFQAELLEFYGGLLRWQWGFLLLRYLCSGLIILQWGRIGDCLARKGRWSSEDRQAFQDYRWRALVWIVLLEVIVFGTAPRLMVSEAD